MNFRLPATVLAMAVAEQGTINMYGKVDAWRWGVNGSAISKISEGHTVMIVRAAGEA